MKMNLKVLEWFGVVTAIAYSLFVASNAGLEFLGFVLLFISAISIGAWAYLGGHRDILLLQFYYAVAGPGVVFRHPSLADRELLGA